MATRTPSADARRALVSPGAPGVVSIGRSVYEMRTAAALPTTLPRISAGHVAADRRRESPGAPGARTGGGRTAPADARPDAAPFAIPPFLLASSRRPLGTPSPPVLIHRSYLARVASAPGFAARTALSDKLAGEYRMAWLERELARPIELASTQPPDAGTPDAKRAWDPHMLHEHVVGCAHARAGALRAIHRFGEGMLPERALSHRHQLPLRNKLRDDLSHLVGALRLTTLDLGEALQAWEAHAGSPLFLPTRHAEHAPLPTYALMLAAGSSDWLPVPLGTDPLLLRWFGELDTQTACHHAAHFVASRLHSAEEQARMRSVHDYLVAHKWGRAVGTPRETARALAELPTLENAPGRTNEQPHARARAHAKLALLLYGSAHGYERQQYLLHGAHQSLAAQRLQAVQRGKVARVRAADARRVRAEVALASDPRVSALSLRKRRIEQRLREVRAALAAEPRAGADVRRAELERAQLLGRRLELEAQLGELGAALSLAAAVGIQACFLRFKAVRTAATARQLRNERMAARIQAAWRGKRARSAFRRTAAVDELRLVETELAWIERLHAQAAVLVQAHVRGMLVRTARARGAAGAGGRAA
ncbi:hypothetical protein KFE25_006779 [Diacronema lutheri]|uniref:Uncharacterized protein n=1 Tax=Diacronema lutheri TaxID=2081491 RepID=A0A8J5XSK8_DIALT|nr:hypothetical protein KFE25_006779 [Diacronema lutheri]